MGLLAIPGLQYRGMVGTGGIGTGTVYLLDGNETLRREESRSGRILDRRDFCKLHIVCHYVKVLLGGDFAVYPVGRVGDDEAGARLVRQMTGAGLDLRYVASLPGVPTLSSICLLYPDGSGGNLTAGNTASAMLDRVAIAQVEPVLEDLGERGIALALPEVPLAARTLLLDLARRHRLLRVASFTRAEMDSVRSEGLLDGVDHLAVNLEEAAAAAGVVECGNVDSTVCRIVGALSARHPRLRLSVTAGTRGSWSWDGASLSHDPPVRVEAVAAAGAGDAHLAGIVAGTACGLPLHRARQLGTILASASVTSPHTIHPGIDGPLLRDMAARMETLCPEVRLLLKG